MKIVKPENIKPSVAVDFVNVVPNKGYGTILADPPWRFTNRTGKVAPEHRRLNRYDTLSFKEIMEIPVSLVAGEKSHLYLWVPNALLQEGLEVMKAWGFQYKSNIVWHKVRKDGGPDGRGVGFYFRNTTELILFGIRGRIRTLQPGRSQVNIIRTRKQEHSRKPNELYGIIEKCSKGPFLEIFARGKRNGWDVFGNQAEEYNIKWQTYKNNSQGNHKKDPSILELTFQEAVIPLKKVK
jgi:N6-adenosine-specific RNA methylase IME4